MAVILPKKLVQYVDGDDLNRMVRNAFVKDYLAFRAALPAGDTSGWPAAPAAPPTDPFSGEVPYVEVVGNEAPYTDAFSATDAGTAMTIRVPFALAYDAAMSAVGYRYTDGTTLRQVPPMRHPFYQNLYVASVPQVRYMRYEGTAYEATDAVGEEFRTFMQANYRWAILTL